MASNPLKAQYARIRAAEAREAEKQKACKAARPPPAYAKAVLSTSARAASRRAALAAEEAAPTSFRVIKGDGSSLSLAKAMYLIQSMLKAREHHSEASLDEIHAATGIDVGAAANAKLDEALRNCEHVEPIQSAGMALRLRYRPKHGVRDASMLAALLSRAVVNGVPRSELLDCFEGAAAEIDKLIASGKTVAIESADTKDRILFAPPLTARVPQALVDAWKAVSVPRGDDLQAELVKRKLLSQDELEVRRSRRALAAKAREEAKKAAKPRQARLAARKMTNTHLDIN